MIIKNEADVAKLKKWDVWVAQEYLDTIASMTLELDADKIKSVHDKWNGLVSEHIKKLDLNKVKEYEKKR